MNIKLTDTQREVLKLATYRPDGNLEPLPPTLRGGARKKVIEGLLIRELITASRTRDGVEYFVTDAGYAAVGRERKLAAPAAGPERKWRQDAVTKRDATDEVQNLDATRRAIRPGTKLAEIIGAMKRPGGATIAEMMASTGWQSHTLRGTISGMIKKRLGLNVASAKGADGERRYHIA